MLMHADVNLDNAVTASDALAVINALESLAAYDRNHDVNGDGQVSALDALKVINLIGRWDQIPYFSIRLGGIHTNGLTDEQVRWAINEAGYEFTEVTNFRWKLVDSGGHVLMSSGELYLGNRYHARGWYKPGHIQFHSGRVSDRPDLNYQWSPWRGNPVWLKQVLKHEFLHFLGWGHSNDRNCVHHIDASAADFCALEKNWLRSHYGASPL